MNDKNSRIIEVKWELLKNGVRRNELSIEDIDKSSRELLDYMGELTMKGVTHVMGTSLNVYKDRVWNLIEKVGLLPE